MIRPVGEAIAPPKRPKLPNLATLGDVSRDTSENVVSPITSSLNATTTYAPHLNQGLSSTASSMTSTPMVASLGATGGALAGVAGVKDMLTGVATGDKARVLSGATDVTVSATALSTLGMIGGAALLGPAGTVMLSVRGWQRLNSSDRSHQLKGLGDLFTAAALLVTLAPVGAPVRAAIALGASAGTAVRGLHDLREGHDSEKAVQRADGFGQLISSAGILMLSTGFATLPGLGLVIFGNLLPVMARIKPLHGPITKAVNLADRHLYKTGVRVDDALTTVGKKLRPMLGPVKKALGVLSPLRQPFVKVEDAAMGLARKGINAFAHTHLAQSLDTATGKLLHRLEPYMIVDPEAFAAEQAAPTPAPEQPELSPEPTPAPVKGDA